MLSYPNPPRPHNGKSGSDDNINDPQGYTTPQSTVEAILHCVRTRGLAALREHGNEERLSRCDEAAMKQIRERIERMREKGLLP